MIQRLQATNLGKTGRIGRLQLYDPENQTIVACSQSDWDLAVRVMGSGRMLRLGELCTTYQGEVNETSDGAKGFISDQANSGPQILRGANVCLYMLREASQGESIYLKKSKYLAGKKPGAKAWHHKQQRLGFQRKSPQNNFRRIIACLIPKDQFCCDSVSYVPQDESKLPLTFILGILNSKLLDWYFRLGSTNSSVNEYQFKALPAPAFNSSAMALHASKELERALVKKDWNAAFDLATAEPFTPPFPEIAATCLVRCVESIIKIEESRGEIARSERSALSIEAQPYQDLIDRLLYRMAGLSDVEANDLEQRLQNML